MPMEVPPGFWFEAIWCGIEAVNVHRGIYKSSIR
jgi:hypothetical protein